MDDSRLVPVRNACPLFREIPKARTAYNGVFLIVPSPRTSNEGNLPERRQLNPFNSRQPEEAANPASPCAIANRKRGGSTRENGFKVEVAKVFEVSSYHRAFDERAT